MKPVFGSSRNKLYALGFKEGVLYTILVEVVIYIAYILNVR